MDDSKLVTNALSRTLKTTQIAAKSGVKHLGYLGAKRFSSNPDELQKKHETEIGKILFAGLSQMRGTALKASQLLSMEVDILPEGIRQELAKSCYQVPPINKALVRKVFKEEFGTEPGRLFSTFSPTSFAAASLGQVHKAAIDGHGDVAVKVQYPGIRESIDSDLNILAMVLSGVAKTTPYLPHPGVIKDTLSEIESCLRQEIDYQQEAINTRWFKENLRLPGIHIPEVFDDYSASRVLTTTLIPGLHIDAWLETHPTQQQRNQVGQTLFDVFIHSVFELQVLHADPHAGNYLFLDASDVALLDFGCIVHVTPDFATDVAALMRSILSQQQDAVLSSYQTLGLLAPSLSMDQYVADVLPALQAIQHWMCLPFTADHFDFKTLPAIPVADPSKHPVAIRHLNAINRDQMYFDRTYIGIYQLLRKLGAVVKTHNQWVH